MSQQLIFEQFRIHIENEYINYDEIHYWGYDCDNGSLFISYSHGNVYTCRLTKSLYDDFEATLKQQLKELFEQNEFQCLEP